MKVLLIGPQSRKEDAERSFMAPALGVVRLAGYLNANGHEAEAFDPNLSMLTGKPPHLTDKFAEKDWDFIGFSVLEETLIKDIENMYLAKKLQLKATLVAGGIEAQFNYQTILEKSPCNYVLISEAELALLQLVNGDPIHTIDGIVFKSNSKPLSQELFNSATSTIEWEKNTYEEYWDYYLSKYGDKVTSENLQEIHTVRLFSRNRCPIGCKFCSSTNQITWGANTAVPVISASEDTLIDNIKRIKKSHPRTKTIYLTDDDFCINRRSVIRFCKKVIEEKFDDLSFMCFARASDLTDEMCFWMKKANFRRLNIGIESFSEKVLIEMNKRCDVEKNHHGLKMLKNHGIKTFMNIIMTTPESTIDDVETTVDNAMIYASDPFFHAGITLAIKPLKGTEYYEQYSDYLSVVEEIPETRFHIKRDDIILASDSQVRELQFRYWNTIDSVIQTEIAKNDVRHTVASNLSLFKLRYMKSLIEDVRRKNKPDNGNRNVYDKLCNDPDSSSSQMPFHERQTIDIPETTGSISHKSSKGDNKSVHGSF